VAIVALDPVAEVVTLQNQTAGPIDLSGWRLLAGDERQQYRFPEGMVLGPGARLRLHTGQGTDSAGDLYWGRRSAVWRNSGDTATLLDGEGRTVATYRYGTP